MSEPLSFQEHVDKIKEQTPTPGAAPGIERQLKSLEARISNIEEIVSCTHETLHQFISPEEKSV